MSAVRTREQRAADWEAGMQAIEAEFFWAGWLRKFGGLCIADPDLAAPFLPPFLIPETLQKKDAA